MLFFFYKHLRFYFLFLSLFSFFSLLLLSSLLLFSPFFLCPHSHILKNFLEFFKHQKRFSMCFFVSFFSSYLSFLFSTDDVNKNILLRKQTLRICMNRSQMLKILLFYPSLSFSVSWSTHFLPLFLVLSILSLNIIRSPCQMFQASNWKFPLHL